MSSAAPPSSAGPAIEFNDVWKVYRLGPVEYPALRGLTLTVPRAQVTAIAGPSGSGKSTFLHIAGTLDRPTRGMVRLDGRDVARLGENHVCQLRNRRIGFIFQAFNLIPRLSAIENVALPLAAQGVGQGERLRRAAWALQQVGLGQRLRNRPYELSGGEQQRVAIARAIVTEPAFLLCDEPTGNLDSATTREIVQVLVRINREHGTTVVVVTHNPEVAGEAHRVVRLRDGRVEREEVKRPLAAE